MARRPLICPVENSFTIEKSFFDSHTHRNCIHNIFGIFDIDVETLLHEAAHKGINVLPSIQNIFASCIQVLETLLRDGKIKSVADI